MDTSRSRILQRIVLTVAWGCTTVPCANAAETSAPSSSLEAVRRELSADALFYSYLDFEKGWGEVGRQLTAALKESPAAEAPVDFEGAFQALGIAQVRALGLSSAAVPGGYDNRFFLHTPSGRTGIFSFFPPNPAPFTAAQYAPADADLVIDLRIDAPALIKTIEAVAAKMSGKREVAEAFLAELSKNDGENVAQFVAYRGRAIAIARMHPQEQIERAHAEFSRELPFDAFVQIESGGSAILKELSQKDTWSRTDNAGRSTFTRKIESSGETENTVVVVEGEKLSVGFPLSFVEECLAKKGGLAGNPAYRDALAATASEGQLLLYVTPRVISSLRDAAKWLFLFNSGLFQRSARDTLSAEQVLSLLPMPEKPMASVVIAREDGILVRGHSVESLKASLPIIGLITPDFCGRIAVYAARAWVVDNARRHESELARKKFEPALIQIGEAARKYFASHPDLETVTLTELRSAFSPESLPDLNAVASAEMEIARASDVVSFEHNTLGPIQYVFPLTDGQRAAIEKNLRDLDHAALETMIIDDSRYAYGGTLIDSGWIDPKPVSLLGEDYTALSPTLDEPRLSITTRGGQEVAIERERKAVMRARRSVAERQLQVEQNLARIAAAARQYFATMPDSSYVSFEDLGTLKPDLIPVIGENYSELTFARDFTEVTLSHPRLGRITYLQPPTAEAIAELRTRLQKLERAAAAYFAKNPSASLVISGEIYEDAPATTTEVSANDARTAGRMSDLTAIVIRRDYEAIEAALGNGHKVSVPRTKPPR